MINKKPLLKGVFSCVGFVRSALMKGLLTKYQVRT